MVKKRCSSSGAYIWFLTNLYWRSPLANKTFTELVKREGLSNKYFGFYKGSKENPLTDDEIPDIKNSILSDSEIQKIFRVIMPNISGNIEEMYRLLNKWMLFDVFQGGLITGDNPFINNNQNLNLDNVFDDFLFPISNNRLIIFREKCSKFLDSTLIKYFNLSVLYSSNRFVCAPNKETILEILRNREELEKRDLYTSVVEILFEVISIQSKFDTFEKYVSYHKLNQYKFRNRFQ